MTDKSQRRPTEFELEILQELWRKGPLTVRQVYDVLNAQRSMVYTTVLKAMQVMFEKGIVTRDDSQRSHIYASNIAEEDVKSRVVKKIVDQVFNGSAADLAMHALETRSASQDEIRKIKVLLEELEANPGVQPGATSATSANAEKKKQ